MTTLRIRHYIGTIVAACALGGLLLSFELAFLFQDYEREAAEQVESSGTLAAVAALRGDVEDWLRDTSAGLGDPERVKFAEQDMGGLLIRLEALKKMPDAGVSEAAITKLASAVKDAFPGVKHTTEVKPGSELFEKRCSTVRALLEGEWSGRIQDSLTGIDSGLQARLRERSAQLETKKARLWRTAIVSVAAYATLVLVLWLWVASRLLRPLKALTRESRRTLGGEASFQLRPDGPHEVRLLTESLSSLVGSLVGARENLEERVQERTRELERANQAKNEFLANMSHEIRTPMTAILGYAELCLAANVSETDRRRYSEIIHANGEHLLSVINDILDVSKIEAGRMTVEPTQCSPFEVVSEVRALMEVRAREKGLELRVERRGPVPELVRTDPTRLRQILLNLLNNAIKFTEQGEVVLRCGLETETDGAERLVFEVEDTGVGLSPEQITRVFRPFVQADTSTTRKYGGSGLGLTISQTLARLLGGDLTCHSEPGKGSTFRVVIDPGPLEGVRRLEPTSADPAGPPAALPSAPTTVLSGRVLLAEDVAVNRRLIATILLRTGIRVEEAENGLVALEKTLAARDAGEPFDIVFMDMQMPEMDGYEATRLLRQGGYLRPIVALTSHSMSGERQRCLEAGCDEYMTKPIDRLVFLQVLARFLPSAEAEQHAAA